MTHACIRVEKGGGTFVSTCCACPGFRELRTSLVSAWSIAREHEKRAHRGATAAYFRLYQARQRQGRAA